MAVPVSQKRHAMKTESRRPILSERGPAKRAPTTEPAARAEPMAPWTTPRGFLKYETYCLVPIMALMDEMSKPKLDSGLGSYSHKRKDRDTYSIPPIVAMMARK